MAIIATTGSKGGVGTSLVATNLGCALARAGETILIDLHNGTGVDDLLLDSNGGKGWAALLDVLGELQPKHIELASSEHSSKLKLMPGPAGWPPDVTTGEITQLIQALDGFFDWCLLDLPVGLDPVNQAVLSISDVSILVTSADPPALRSADRFVTALAPESRDHLGLVVNQINRQHPSTASQIADSLGVPLLAAVAPDPRAVGYQVHFGRTCAQDNTSLLGRSIHRLAARLQRSATDSFEAVPPISQDGGMS